MFPMEPRWTLTDLRYHYPGYVITGSGKLWVAYSGTGRVLRADSAEALRDALRADVASHPRPEVMRLVRKFS